MIDNKIKSSNIILLMIPVNKPTIVRKDLEYVLNCLITERLEEGELTKEFEKSVSHLINVKYALATGTFSSALHLGLLGLGIEPGDEIIISAYSPSSYINIFNYLQVKPVLVDIELDTYNIDIKQLEQKIGNRTKAIIIRHNFGIPANLDQILGFNIPIIEDCSYALGAEYSSSVNKDQTKIGSFGVISLFSFDTDTVITAGNGGMLVSNTRDFINKAKQYKYNPYNMNNEYEVQYDYRMPDISAALGLSQIKIIKKLLNRRLELAEYYNERLKRSKYKMFHNTETQKSIYSKYVLAIEGNLDKAVSYLRKNKIDSRKPILNPAFLMLQKDEKEYPNTTHCFHKLFEIPVYPSLKKKELELIANTLLRIY